MELSQVSGMTSSPARMGNNTSAGAGSGSVVEDTATAASARTGNNKSVDTMLAASVAAAAEGAEEISATVATPVRHLIKPTGKTGAFWGFYQLYHPNHHPGNLQNVAHCTLCQTDISIKGRTTTGLTKHLRFKHREQYESMNDNKADDSHTSVASIFPKRAKEPDIKERKMMFIYVARNFIIEGCHSFNMVENTDFRNLFRPFHKDADQITNVSRYRVREEIMSLGGLAIKATKLEVEKHKGSWTTDHWTGCDDATYTTTTFHFIKKDWKLQSLIVDFKVFHGTTSGQAIYIDQVTVLEKFTTKSNVVIGISDTAGNMGVLGQYLRRNGMEHGYCTDHVMHLVALKAFSSEYQTALDNQFLAVCLTNIFSCSLSTDTNVPNVDGLMSKARKIIEYFNKSTQQNAKLLNFQRDSPLAIYSGPGFRPKKLLQDVVTRWWSSYRMLKRLRFLKAALIALHVDDEITCVMLSPEEWLVLEQIEICLAMMAQWQRILEGEKYPTGSLVVSAVFSIRAHFVDVIDSAHTLESVKRLAKILLNDFDQRYHPPGGAGNEGKVNFTPEPVIGIANRYTGVHPYFFIAAFLDPRNKKALKNMLVPNQYNALQQMILDRMVRVGVAWASDNATKNNSGEDRAEKNYQQETTCTHDGIGLAFQRLYDDDDGDDDDDDIGADSTTIENNIRIRCQAQLEAYKLVKQMKMRDNEGNFNDPLKYWAGIEHQSPELSQLAKEFLSIPATSAPSERVWSRAARVIRAKRARLDPDITARMMFAQENSDLIREYWNKLKPNEPLPNYYLPPPLKDVDDNGDSIDVGQNDNYTFQIQIQSTQT